MKKELKKWALKDANVLSDSDKKGIRGGSGSSGSGGSGGSGGGSGSGASRFRCSCGSGAIAVSWEGLYATTEAIQSAINVNCGEHGGTCTAI